MENKIDDRRFRRLMEESQDLQSDVIRYSRDGLDGYVEVTSDLRAEADRERRRLSPVAIAAGAAGAFALASAVPAWAQANNDVAALQTAASLENLAVFTYKTALTLPFIGGASANPVVKAFSDMTMKQHAQHADAFNAAATKAGGKAQTATNPKYTPIVQQMVPTLKTPADVVKLAVTLEDVATQTYVQDTANASTPELRKLFLSIGQVEAQHKATLLAVQALLAGGGAALIAIPTDVAKLPEAAGSVGFPDAFEPTKNASPPEEGAVK